MGKQGRKWDLERTSKDDIYINKVRDQFQDDGFRVRVQKARGVHNLSVSSD